MLQWREQKPGESYAHLPEVHSPKRVGRIKSKSSLYHQLTVTPGNVLWDTDSSISVHLWGLCARHPTPMQEKPCGGQTLPHPALAWAFPPQKSPQPFQITGCELRHESVPAWRREDVGTAEGFLHTEGTVGSRGCTTTLSNWDLQGNTLTTWAF